MNINQREKKKRWRQKPLTVHTHYTTPVHNNPRTCKTTAVMQNITHQPALETTNKPVYTTMYQYLYLSNMQLVKDATWQHKYRQIKSSHTDK